MTPARQPQEYIITMSRIIKARNMLMVDGYHNADVLDRMVNLLRARPHASAPVPEEQLREAYQNGFTDGQAKAAIENERINAQVAKAAREQAETTDNILTVLKKRYRKEMAIVDYIEMIECEVESLRSQQEPQQ